LVASKWTVSMEPDRRLSDCLKVMPPEDVETVERALIVGGFARLVSNENGDAAGT
jgi:hypothetical protein